MWRRAARRARRREQIADAAGVTAAAAAAAAAAAVARPWPWRGLLPGLVRAELPGVEAPPCSCTTACTLLPCVAAAAPAVVAARCVAWTLPPALPSDALLTLQLGVASSSCASTSPSPPRAPLVPPLVLPTRAVRPSPQTVPPPPPLLPLQGARWLASSPASSSSSSDESTSTNDAGSSRDSNACRHRRRCKCGGRAGGGASAVVVQAQLLHPPFWGGSVSANLLPELRTSHCKDAGSM
eukprot:350808-Chlamydomonas_euryale.AAC.3